MSLEALAKAMDTTGLTPVEKLALIFLADNYTDGAGVGRLPLTHPSQLVAGFACCTVDEATAAVKGLFAKRVLTRVPAPVTLLFDDEQRDGVWFHVDVTRRWEIAGAAEAAR